MILVYLFLLADLSAEIAKLQVHGHAELKKPADQVSLSIGVVTEAQNARDAVEANNKKMNRVINALSEFGLEKKDYETGQFQVVPQYAPRPKETVENWKPKITSYQVSNSLKVKIAMLEQLGEILDSATVAGANSIGDIQFNLKDPREYRKEAITTATQNAVQDAKNLAEAAGVKLGNIISLTLDQADIRPLFRAAMMNEGVPIESGDVDVNAGVNITYEIQ